MLLLKFTRKHQILKFQIKLLEKPIKIRQFSRISLLQNSQTNNGGFDKTDTRHLDYPSVDIRVRRRLSIAKRSVDFEFRKYRY